MIKRGGFIFVTFVFLIVCVSFFVSAGIIERGNNWDKFDEGNGVERVTVYSGFVNDYNGTGYERYNLSFTVSSDPLYDYQGQSPNYMVFFIDNPSLGQVVKYSRDNVNTTFQPHALNYRNYLNMVSQVKMVQSVTGISGENVFVYPNAYGSGIDLQYYSLPYVLKQELVINSFSDLVVPPSFITDQPNVTLDLDFVFDTNAQDIVIDGFNWDKSTLTRTKEEVYIRDSGGNVIYYFPKPYAYDNSGERVELTYEFKKQGGSLYINLKTPYDWLNSTDRVYPVYIDPSIEVNTSFSGGRDSYISEDKNTQNYGGLSYFQADSEENSKEERSILYFNLSFIPNSSQVINATLSLYMQGGAGEIFNLSVYRLTQDWTEGGVTWDTYDGVNSWLNLGGDYDSFEYDKILIDLTLGWKNWNVSSLVQQLVNGTYTNKGFILIPEPGSGNNWKQFASSENANQSIIPRLEIFYTNESVDTNPPNWVIEPMNQTINETESFSYDIEATDDVLIDKYFIDDTTNFSINQTGFIQNVSVLPVGNYSLNISVNDTSGNLLSKVIFVNVNSLPMSNTPPLVNQNLTIVNGSEKDPEYGESFFVRVNLTDLDGDGIEFVNFTIVSPNGTSVVDNVKGKEFLEGNNSIWNSSNYTVDSYGAWNWFYVLSDGANEINGSGSFRVFSDLIVFPASYVNTPDPYNETLVWNLSLYHLSDENYTLNFSYDLNQTYFNLTIEKDGAIVSGAVYNSSNFFRNGIVIEINSSVPLGIYSGHINITRQEDGAVFVVPIEIGINPPSGNIDAFSLDDVRCMSGSCDVSAQMENDETKTFSWKLKNVGDYMLSNCSPSISGFGLSKFGSFSLNNFELNISEEVTLNLVLDKPSINSYYGELEVVCRASSLGFNSSLGAEGVNVPGLNILVLADSGTIVNPPSSSGGGPSSRGDSSSGGGGIIPLQSSLSVNQISDFVVNNVGVKKILSWKVKNTGTSYLNDCVFGSSGDLSSWITATDSFGLAAGEEYEIVFDVNIPEDIEAGNYDLEVNLICQEANGTEDFSVEVVDKTLDFEFVNIERDGEESVRVDYTLEELSGENQDVGLEFLLFDMNDKRVARFNDTMFVAADSLGSYTSYIPIPAELEGELRLLVNVNSETYSGFVQENLVLGGALSGYTIFDRIGDSDNFVSVILVILFLSFTFFVVKRIRAHRAEAANNVKEMIKENKTKPEAKIKNAKKEVSKKVKKKLSKKKSKKRS